MELIVRMRRYMVENKLGYKITYIPDPLCWTEAPSIIKYWEGKETDGQEEP